MLFHKGKQQRRAQHEQNDPDKPGQKSLPGAEIEDGNRMKNLGKSPAGIPRKIILQDTGDGFLVLRKGKKDRRDQSELKYVPEILKQVFD